MSPAGRACALLLLLLSATAARAEIRVEITGVEDRLRSNVLAYLSLQRYATLDDLSEDTLNRLVQRAQREVGDALRPFGYYAPTVRTELTRDERGPIARIAIELGEPVMLKSVEIAIEGPGREEPFLREALAASALAPGRQLDHGAYEQVKGELQQRAAANGYLDARYVQNDLEVDPVKREAIARLKLETGARYRFGTTSIEQDALDPALVRRYLRYREGDWYNSSALLRTQFALDDTAYFNAVEVLPGDRDPEKLIVPVTIQAGHNERNRYTIGVGYETDFGPRVRFGWENRLLNRKGHRLRFEANLARANQTGSLTYAIPIGDPALEKVEFTLTASNLELADVTTRALTFRPSLTRVLGRWQRVTFVDFVHGEQTAGGVRTSDTLVVPGISFAPVPRGFTAPGALGGTLSGAIDQYSGFYAELVGSQRSLGSRSDFLRLRVRDDWRWDLAPTWHVLARAELGTTAVRNFEDLPAQYRFFAGGDRSVRGFGFNTLSPRVAAVLADGSVDPGRDGILGTADDPTVRTGGKHLLVGSVELERDLPRNFAIAVFADAGNAFNAFGDRLEYSAGIGLRYKLPFVSVGIDVAQPLSRGGSPRLHLNITPVF